MNRFLPIFTLLLLPAMAAMAAENGWMAPGNARIRELGNLQQQGWFSFWTEGQFGDWFVADSARKIRVTVICGGKTIGDPPRMGVELLPLLGDPRAVAIVDVIRSDQREYTVELDAPAGYFGIRFKHLNRVAGEGNENLRHLIVSMWRIDGARLAESSAEVYRLFGNLPYQFQESDERVTCGELTVELDRSSCAWRAIHVNGTRLETVRPAIGIAGMPVDLRIFEEQFTRDDSRDSLLGPGTILTATYTKPGELQILYSLEIAADGVALIARLDLSNPSARNLVVSHAAPAIADGVSLTGATSQWRALTDGKQNAHPCELATVSEVEELSGWWYLAMRNRDANRSLLFGTLKNDKGLGRFLLLPKNEKKARVAAWCDYENIVMPAGASIRGEPMLIHFGKNGNDSLERFGDSIAAAHGINLRRDHPLDTHTEGGLNLFTAWNGYGAGVVRGFDYKHDAKGGRKPFEDPNWVRANRQMVNDLRLTRFGYNTTAAVRGLPTPLVRRYGAPDFWFPEARKIREEYPDFYIGDCIDFSHPGVLKIEAKRVSAAFQQPVDQTLRYSWDFTNHWKKLPGQHDPFLTSAETYRAAMNLWRQAGKAHAKPAYAYAWMNIVGINYDLIDVIHIGHDSDQGYAGEGLTFTHGLTKQISGRYFLNGRVWWNSPDSYHVYCGGIYSYPQAKVHASFCSLSGNLVHLAEPFTDQETPDDRIEIIRRVSPTTADVGIAVDVFDHAPARLWHLPIERPFGNWSVVGLFNTDYDGQGTPIAQRIDFAELGLDANKTWLVYEFWSRKFLGEIRGGFERTLPAPDCEVYAIIERRDHPVLVSTSRHVRQMAYDIRDLRWDDASATLRGISKVVESDPYQLRIYVPAGFRFKETAFEKLAARHSQTDRMLLIDIIPVVSGEIDWTVSFVRG